MGEKFFGENISEAIRVIRGLFRKEEVKILDCPFCKNYLKITDTMNRAIICETETEYYVKCPNCKCCGPVGENYTQAVELWNDRKEI